MKKYPYTESTDLIIYDQKPKKEKKQKVQQVYSEQECTLCKRI